MRHRFQRIAPAAGCVLAFAAVSIAIHSGRPLVAEQAVVPVAYSLYCLDHLDECRPGPAMRIEYTPELSGLLQMVNRAVNLDIRPVAETNDTWTLDPAEGDCDDYVMTKRSRLITAGVPIGALGVAIVKTQKGEGHAVLIVKTTGGDLVLDNIRQTIVRREEARYRILSLT